MFYKILYAIITAIVCLITYYIANALTVSNRLIKTWRNAADSKDYTEILKWSDKYNPTPVKTIENEKCKVEIYQVYNKGTETNAENNTYDVEAVGYEFIITLVNGENVNYSKSETNSTDANIVFYYPGKIKNENDEEVDGIASVSVGYYSYEFENIHAVSQMVLLTDSSANLSVNEQFKETNKVDVTGNYTKVEIRDTNNEIMIEINDLSSEIDLTNLQEWENGYTDAEKDAFMKPDNYMKVIGPVLIALAIFTLGFFLIFFRKKKDRLYLSDSVKPKQSSTVKSSSVKPEEVTDIIDEDKIEADDVDENSLL